MRESRSAERVRTRRSKHVPAPPRKTSAFGSPGEEAWSSWALRAAWLTACFICDRDLRDLSGSAPRGKNEEQLPAERIEIPGRARRIGRDVPVEEARQNVQHH